MDHLPIPESCQDRAWKVPYLGVAPAYDRRGFWGFPERCGLNAAIIVNPATAHTREVDQNGEATTLSREYIESFLQEWLWFGMLHEFEMLCGLEMDPSIFITPEGADKRRFITAKPLVDYARRVAIDRLIKQGVPLDLRVGDWVYLKRASTNGTRHRRFEIIEVLDNMRYRILNRRGERVVSVADLEQPGLECESVQGTPSLLESLSSTPLLVFCSVLERMHDSQNPHKENQSRFAKCLEEVQRLTFAAWDHDPPVFRVEVAVSIDILVINLGNATREILREEIEVDGTSRHCRTAIDKVLNENWCPARKNFLKFEHIDLYYVASLLPSYESLSHDDCRGTKCSYRAKALNQFQAQHRIEGCAGDCPEVVFEEARLASILEAGGTPGVATLKGCRGKIAYKVVDVTGNPYVAISHVWSHGLGNPSRNALPLCQIEHLFGLLERLGTDLLLWIDTLSVPTGLEYKRKAILGLRNVYRQATKVLVIDRHLLRVGPHWLERRAQLICSEWMKRLWTLQEGRLASDLYIQFRDEAVSVTGLLSLTPTLHTEFDSEILSGLHWFLGHKLESFFEKVDNIRVLFSDLMEDLSTRDVTVPADEAICLATLLDIPIENFHPFPTMMDVYASLSSLPQGLLFCPAPRLEIPRFRWAPESLLGTGEIKPTLSSKPAILGDKGLLLHGDCIVLQRDFEFRPGSMHDLYFVACPKSAGFAVRVREFILGGKSVFKAAAILVEHPGKHFREFCRGVLVSDMFQSKGVWHCHLEMFLWVYRINAFTHREVTSSLNEPAAKAYYGKTTRRWILVMDLAMAITLKMSLQEQKVNHGAKRTDKVEQRIPLLRVLSTEGAAYFKSGAQAGGVYSSQTSVPFLFTARSQSIERFSPPRIAPAI
ncbi:hypothetical protein MMC30_004529 [Trapelia coarctata]|nr:hypothetical protein [Trapelia coarctata]